MGAKERKQANPYTRALGDFLYIFREFHTRRIDNHEANFLIPSLDSQPNSPFSLDYFVGKDKDRSAATAASKVHNIIEYFSAGLHYSMGNSLKRFFSEGGVFFEAAFVQNLIEVINQNHASSGQHFRIGFSIETVIDRGLGTAADATTHIAALHCAGMIQKPSQAAVALSMIGIDSLESAMEDLRFSYAHARKSHSAQDSPSKLVDSSCPYALNPKLLQNYGFGTASGCPAAMKPSSNCVAFLEGGFNIRKVPQTVIKDLVERALPEYQEKVVKWYSSLQPQQRERLIHPSNRDVLDAALVLRQPQSKIYK